MIKELKRSRRRGFSLVEVLLVVGLLVLLFSFGAVIYSSFTRADQFVLETGKIRELINEARVRSVSGISLGGSQALSFGIYFQTDGYTLFPGTAYNSADTRNQRFSLPVKIEISEINLPANSLIFERISGEVLGFDPVSSHIVVTDLQSDRENKIIINRFGVVTVEHH